VAIKSNLTIDQGANFTTSINVTDVNDVSANLTNYTGAAQLRKHYTSNTATNFTVAVSANGLVTLSMNAAVSANLVSGRYVYDCEITANTGTVTRLVEGIVTITPNVTKP
jgi:hypothetical protein